jgi:hypothetical protein
MMNFLKRSLSLEIEDFITYLKTSLGKCHFKSFTQSAFIQCRKKINHEVYIHLSNKLALEFYTDNDASVKLWNGFRLLAIDGSDINLPNTHELELIYGKRKNQYGTTFVQAKVSVMYDVLNHIVIDSAISPWKTGEHALAVEHLKASSKGDLIIYDRGYPSFNLIFEHVVREIDFLIRSRIDFSNQTKSFYESGADSEVVAIKPRHSADLTDKKYGKDTSITVRLVKVNLPNGTTEILISSLIDEERFPNDIFKDLYAKRWGVETFYDELKNKIKTENFSGYSQHSILQDFYAAIFVSNVQSLIVGEINDEIALKTKTKLKYKVNNNLSYGFLKNRIISMFFDDSNINDRTDELRALFKKHLVPIRPDRKFKRIVNKYQKRAKPKVLKNMKDAV